MVVLAVLPILFGIVGMSHGAPPEVSCPVPISPEHGQAFLYQEGQVVKYVCEPGYAIKGKELVRCVDGQWEEPNPACLKIGEDDIEEDSESISDSLPLVPPARPLFSWGSENEQDDSQEENNSTSDEMLLSDEARVRLLMYPRRRARIVTSTVRTGRLHSATELEEEEKRSEEGKADTSTTIHLEAPPSVVYVRRTVTPGKSEVARRALEEQYKMASLHMSVDDGHDVQVVTLPRAAVSQDDKGQQAEQTLRQLYWYAHHNYPRQASYLEYRRGSPVSMTLTESQLAWINSLHPELRDKYLKDLYVMRAEETVEGERAQAFLRRYGDAYNYYYNLPYYRQPMSLVVDNVAATYDYTCNSAGNHAVTAPNLPNMYVARYDHRKNIHEPHNYYLSAVYQCNPGYYMLDPRISELYCSKGRWVGLSPVCVSNP